MSRAAIFRILLLPLAAALIVALVTWRLWREPNRDVASALQPLPQMQLAPRFELYDQNNQLVKFERYLGRTRLVVVFFDAAEGADRDPYLARLRDEVAQVEAAGGQVIGISTATPYANQQAEQRAGREFPFPLLTDIDPRQPIPAPVHQQWGLYDKQAESTRTGLFLVSRSGMVAMNGGFPSPEKDPQHVVNELRRGEWPEAAP